MDKSEEIFVKIDDIFNDTVEPKKIVITDKIINEQDNKINNLVIHHSDIYRNKTIIERKIFDDDWLDEE